MDDRSSAQSNRSQPIPANLVPQLEQQGDIRFTELWCILAERKLVIFLTVLAAAILSVAYLFLAEPRYEAKAYLLPPASQEIQDLSIEGIPIDPFTPQMVYEKFLRNFRSEGLRKRFFDANKLINHYLSNDTHNEPVGDIDRVFEISFSNKLQLSVDNQDQALVIATFSYSNPEFAAQWLNKFIDFADEVTVDQLYGEVNSVIKNEISRRQEEVSRSLKLTSQERQDTIARFKEALAIARVLGIEEATVEQVASGDGQQKIAVNVAQVPLYMRGENALRAQIEVLEARESDEPFTSGVRKLQLDMAFLKNISINRDRLSAVTVDLVASIPGSPTKPNSIQVISIGITLGLLLGLFGAFLIEFLAKAKWMSTHRSKPG